MERQRQIGERNRGRARLPMNPVVPVALFHLCCIQTNFFFFFLFHSSFGVRASLPLFFGALTSISPCAHYAVS